MNTPAYDGFFLDHLQSVQGDGAWYVNHRFIGKGGNGTTFFVTCTSGIHLGFQFCLKVFHRISDDRRRERFLSEVRHYRSLSHPSIVKVYDEGTFKAGGRDYPFAIVDYLPENLEGKLNKGHPNIQRHQSLRYIMNVVSGIAYLHGQSNPIVHRDIKPGNILIGGPTARVGDLGLAKVLMSATDAGTDHGDEDISLASYVAMPRFYRTPELVTIARGEKIRLTTASDIYQIGLVLYQILTGFNPQKPPVADHLEPIQLDVRRLYGIAAGRLETLVRSMLNEQADARPNAHEVLGRLNQCHEEVCEATFRATGVTE